MFDRKKVLVIREALNRAVNEADEPEDDLALEETPVEEPSCVCPECGAKLVITAVEDEIEPEEAFEDEELEEGRSCKKKMTEAKKYVVKSVPSEQDFGKKEPSLAGKARVAYWEELGGGRGR